MNQSTLARSYALASVSLLATLCAILPGCHSGLQSKHHSLASDWHDAIDPRSFNFRALLGNPPPDDSPQHRAEVDRMLALQESRTEYDVKRCKSEEKVTVFAFEGVLGNGFRQKNLPYTSKLMKTVADESKPVWDAAKRVWNRTRPPLADSRIHPCVALEPTPSYPSGHAVRGIVWATLLAQIFPDRRDPLMARGRQIGDDRFLAGMHYPSDVAAGQKLGAEIARRLLADPDFREQLRQAEQECRKTVALGFGSESRRFADSGFEGFEQREKVARLARELELITAAELREAGGELAVTAVWVQFGHGP